VHSQHRSIIKVFNYVGGADFLGNMSVMRSHALNPVYPTLVSLVVSLVAKSRIPHNTGSRSIFW
jgi:hypothetical protein